MEPNFIITNADLSNIYDIIHCNTDDDDTCLRISRYIYLLYCEQLVNRHED